MKKTFLIFTLLMFILLCSVLPGRVHARSVKRFFTNPVGMKFVLIPSGTFLMGSPHEENGRFIDETRHRVTLTKDYYLQTTEVTQNQWTKVMGKNPSFNKECGGDCPVEAVSWNDVQRFIELLNRMNIHVRYRLPTEAEWEYACRAGTNTPFFYGKCISSAQVNYDGRYPLPGCAKSRYRTKTLPVGSYSPNRWGIYDMHGNVWEWCRDQYVVYPSHPVTDPEGSLFSPLRVYRGGSCLNVARLCRSAIRRKTESDTKSAYLGFRLVLMPEGGNPLPRGKKE